MTGFLISQKIFLEVSRPDLDQGSEFFMGCEGEFLIF
jgi:hypothetical protein